MSGDIISAKAPVNIAVIKYWGKRDEKLLIPLNDSVSASFDMNVMCAKTSVCARPDFVEDKFWLNGVEQSFNNPRLINCLLKIKNIAAEQQSVEKDFLKWKVHICSENNFPTAAGLASSAAGYACLTTALAQLYKINTDLSVVARLGSGSASRSIYGGFVRWYSGTKPDGSDSVSKQVVDAQYWSEMRVLILVVSETQKHISSLDGMKITAETSELIKHRVAVSVPSRVEKMCAAIKQKDFATFAELTMKDSNEFHAVCLSAYPPCIYLTETSYRIIEIIHFYNKMCGSPKVAYTFDAGPNACLYLLEDEVPRVLSLINYFFPSSNKDFVKGLPCPTLENVDFLKNSEKDPIGNDLLKYVIYTKLGDGPIILNDGDHLLNECGEPM
ncbi:diphosphomevalonate decarboxylase [Zerene cesonia]|uniref:diphosphomevalonate decarboxylase n=1 Tax=Zerene cesonia TaxID=33412 RepID=UPI0018E4EDC2|nr:diphosphomevalonate decarboxylase [Zerene cesonia]